MKSKVVYILKRVMTASTKTSRRDVFNGKAKRTKGGLTARDLTRNSQGKIVSKNKSNEAKSRSWIKATKLARDELRLTGFQAVGGKTAEGQILLAKVREIFRREGFSK